MNSQSMNRKAYSVFEGTMADMTYVDVEEAARNRAIVLLPVGVIEEHGPHLPLAVDVYGSLLISSKIRDELEARGVRTLIAPPFFWGMNSATAAFAGSFTVREETLVSILWDILFSLRRWGFEKVFVINHHYDEAHVRGLRNAISKVRLDTGVRAYIVMDRHLASRLGFTGKESYILLYEFFTEPASKYLEIHADSYETGFMMRYFGSLVNYDALNSLKSTDLTVDDLMKWRRGWEEARKIAPQGYFGDPSLGTPERGERIIEEIARRQAECIAAFLRG